MPQPKRRLCMEERFVIKRKDFKKLEKFAENSYNTAVVIDYFVVNKPEIEKYYNLVPIIKHLRNDEDVLNAFFIDHEKEINNLNTKGL